MDSVPGSATPEADAESPPFAGSRSTGWLSAIALAEGGLLADVAVVLDLASIYLPVVGLVVSFAVPIPFAILMLRRGARVTLLATAVAAFLVTILAGPHFGWRLGVQCVLGMLLGWAMRRHLRWGTVVALGTALWTVVSLAATLGLVYFVGMPLRDVIGYLRNSLQSLAWLAAWVAGWTGATPAWLAIRPALAALGTLALQYWPALLLTYFALLTAPTICSNYAIASATARVLGYAVPIFPTPRMLRLLGWIGALITAPLRIVFFVVGATKRGPRRQKNHPLPMLNRDGEMVGASGPRERVERR